ncbi:uncharacterized protein LOC132174403 [Corylus avellana]|uniref:uncharacterized protein LOC132174403 n=1 Tax=Corylus avellana TaxID=13451 RepID=UPI00286A0BF9|nr:uncharacterized protein LOC132174403 [Corylus avellana]
MVSCSHGYFYPQHHLIYREELKKDGEKEVVCSWRGCHKPIWGSLHNCVECGNRPVHKDASSKNHCLDFTEKLENEVVCYGCNEPVLGPAYKCSISSECSFSIHKSCADLSPKMNHPLHPDHALSFRLWHNERCDACYKSHDHSFFYYCNSCDFQLDIKCANRNPNDGHQHEFSLLLRRIRFNCDACGQEVNNMAKICNICKLLVHIKCAAIPRKVKIKLHSHFLNLIYSPHEINNRDNMFCRICGDKVNKEYAAYSCQQCSYILHTECLRHFRDRYREWSATSESMPNEYVGHTTHLIKALDQAKDKGPHLGEIQHFSHEDHKLILCDDEIKDDKLCQGCTELIISVPFYSCAQCNFFLHTRCTKLPRTIKQHRLSNFHTLTLLPQAPTKSAVFFCNICSRHHRGFTYNNPQYSSPWRFIDVQCGSIPETLEHEGHEHPFCLAQDSKNRKCKVCPKDNKDHAFVCNGCDFILGIRCANLPLVARHKYDTHLLKLTYAAEDNSREYYCLVCEKKKKSEPLVLLL